MKRVLLIAMITILFAGCGSNKKETSYKGVEQQHNYIADGMKYLQDADIASAIRSFDEAIKQDPTNSENYVVLGKVYFQLKNYDRAVDTLTAAARIDVNNGEAFYWLARSMELDEKEADAVKAAERSAQIFYQQKDEQRFKRSVAFIQTLSNEGDPDQSG